MTWKDDIDIGSDTFPLWCKILSEKSSGLITPEEAKDIAVIAKSPKTYAKVWLGEIPTIEEALHAAIYKLTYTLRSNEDGWDNDNTYHWGRPLPHSTAV